MIRKENTKLSLTRQCKLLKISRSSIYYTPVGFDRATIYLMHKIDRIFTKYPFFGRHLIAAYLPQSGLSAGWHRMRRLMGIMGLQAINRGPNTSKKHPQHKICPYLLRTQPITCAKYCAGGFQIRWTPALRWIIGRSHRQIWQARDHEHGSG